MMSIVAAALLASAASAGVRTSVVGSKHDLSVTGPGPIKAERETRVCVFCHIPHGASSTAPHLSSRPEIGKDHVPYGSSTSKARAAAPTGPTRVCLSCHDGTIAVGQTLRGNIKMNAETAGGRIPANRPSNLGTDLRRTHPVSVDPDALPLRPGKGSHVQLANGKVECTSCHDPHVEVGPAPEGKFLRETTRDGRLCGVCHAFAGRSSHATSSRPFGAAQGNELGFRSVGEAACQACHRSHGADVRGRLLSRKDGDPDDALCLRCHSGAASALDVAREVSKPSAHAMPPGGRHDASEGPDVHDARLPEASAGTPRHVACVDCHDPHAANGIPAAAAPAASGALAGVWGIDLSGARVAQATREYEICLKCHGDSMNKPLRLGLGPTMARRAAQDDDLRRVFDPNAPSSHPVAAPGRSADVPSLLPPLSAASQIYCSDCHASDDGRGAGGSGPRGPHGSIYPFLLERSYSTRDRTPESPGAYALCYKCHDRNVLLSSRSAFPPHRRHVVDQATSCSVCHASHGVSAVRGTATGNAHLIDFDLGVVSPLPGTLQPYTSAGSRAGSCSLACHGTTHNATRY